jgi:formylmethanofuran dehydrogenase subunit E
MSKTDPLPHPSDVWCRNADGTTYRFNTFLEHITRFHGYPAPGLVIGGRMVALALSAMPPGCLFDALVETGNCLPDAVQMLTPCTAGNGWLKVLSLGRFALALYDKHTGEGVRVSLHPDHMAAWPLIDDWFFKRRPKGEQDARKLLLEIQHAGEGIMRMAPIRVRLDMLIKASVGQRALCPRCGESYPLRHGSCCLACQGASPYRTT